MNNQYNPQKHVKWDCTYHVVITPKYRKKVLYDKKKQRIGEIIRELSKQREVEIVAGNARPDHIHMIMRIPPKHSVAFAMGFLKGKSAIKMHQEFCKIKRALGQKSFWSRGYFVSTVGINRAAVEKYVKEQRKRDKYIDGDQLDLNWD